MGLLSSIRESKLFYLGLPTLLLVLYLFLIPSPSVSQIQIQDDTGYIAEGYDFTILGLSPEGQVTRKSSFTLPYWVKNFTITNKLAYVITGDNSIHIIDINLNDPSNPKRVGEWNSPGIAHSIAINGGFAYVANDSDGVRILSFNNPDSPSEIMHIKDLGTVLDVASAQNLVYVARGQDGLDVYDTGSITQSVSKGHYKTDGSINRITLLSDNRALLLVNNNQVQIINFGNLQNIGLVNTFTFDTEIAKAVLSGNRIFVAQKSAGLLIGKVKDDGTLERLTNISLPLYKVLDVASIDNTIFIAAGSGGLLPADISKLDDIQFKDGYSRFFRYKLLIGFLVIVVLLLWLSFFSQFVLPVRTFTDRQKIFYRLLTYLFGRHGPAIFIQNGKSDEEEKKEKKRPGVLWLDSASAAVIRTDVSIKRTIGPGVHFTEKDEFIAGTVDLHTQSQSIGPKESDSPFSEKKEGQSDEEYDQVQNRRKQVSALTRDGIEVIPNISVTFRVDTGLPEDRQSGSRFGYRGGNRKIDKEHEEIDKKAIEKAIIVGEGIIPEPYQRVAWNKLPAVIAVDVWREYLAKFTLDELFEQGCEFPISPPLLPPPKQDDTNRQDRTNHRDSNFQPMQEVFSDILHELIKLLKVLSQWLDNENRGNKDNMKSTSPPPPSIRPLENKGLHKKTALQMVNFMVKARMTMPVVDSINRHGQLVQQRKPSKEYDILNRRGIKIINVSISNLQFDKPIEDQFKEQWTANWLSNAKTERDQIDRRRSYVEVYGQEQAIRQYARALSLAIMRKRPSTPRETLKTLVLRSWFEIMNRDQLLRKMAIEKQYLEDIIKWLELNDP